MTPKLGIRQAYIGTAGWSLRTNLADRFPAEGTHLARYSRVLPAVEINSSFYRFHQPATYRRWAESVPDAFRFSVKLSREITHEKRFVGAEDELVRFLEGYHELGVKGGPILVQTPPTFHYEERRCRTFFLLLRAHFDGAVAVEPRHRSWFTPAAELLFNELALSRVAADPAPVPGGERPSGSQRLVYYRLHGSPHLYHSAYSADVKRTVTQLLTDALDHRETAVWCIFDNTAEGAALSDALEVLHGVSVSGGPQAVVAHA